MSLSRFFACVTVICASGAAFIPDQRLAYGFFIFAAVSLGVSGALLGLSSIFKD